MTSSNLVEHPLVRQVREQIVRTPRVWKRVLMIGLDASALMVALWGAYAIRLANWTPYITTERMILAALAPLIAIPVFIRLGLWPARKMSKALC